MFRLDQSFSDTAVACEAASEGDPAVPVFCFSIDVEPNPGAMARVLEQFAKRGLVPTRWHSDVIDAEAMQIDIQVVGLSSAVGQDIARGLRSIIGVHGVLTDSRAAHTDRRLRWP